MPLIPIINAQHSYATRDNARKALDKATKGMDDKQNIPFLIAVDVSGRFVPVVVGAQFAFLAHHKITIVG